MSTAAQPKRRPGQFGDLPTHRGRRTQAAIDMAARTVIARKGILATTIADIAAEAGRSAASFYNYYDSKEAMVRQWALRFRDEANQRALTMTRHGLSYRERGFCEQVKLRHLILRIPGRITCLDLVDNNAFAGKIDIKLVGS